MIRVRCPCGVEVEAKRRNRHYCDDCGHERRKTISRQWRKKSAAYLAGIDEPVKPRSRPEAVRYLQLDMGKCHCGRFNWLYAPEQEPLNRRCGECVVKAEIQRTTRAA